MSNPGGCFIEKLKKGNVRAFEQVFNTHYADLCRYAQKYVIELDNAREIVQNTFVKLWEIKHSLSQDTSIKSYLYTAVRNNCLDYLKHIRISNEYKKDLLRKIMDSSFKSIASPENCLDGLIEKELENRINDAIAHLPDRCREIFELSRFKGLKYREIAKELKKVFCYSKPFLIMRITAFLLLFSVVQVMAENSYSQNTRLSLNLKDVSIENVLDEIENQSEFYFLFNQKLVNVDRKVDINAKNKQIKDIIGDLFAGENVNCMVLDRQILLSPKYMTEKVNVTRDRQP